MLTVVNGSFQPTIPYDTISFSGAIGDPTPPRADFDIWDQGGTMSFDVGQEVIIWDEHALAEGTITGPVPATPAQNLLTNVTWGFGATGWTDVSGGHITYPATNAVLTFSNLAVGAYYITQNTLRGYAHPGIPYMISCYITEASLVNGDAFLQIQWQDAAGNSLGTVKNTFNPTSSVVRYNTSGTAPAGTVFMQAGVGGDATNSTNSGTITFTTVQLEPMWFTDPSAGPISYPTPDCNFAQVDCYLLPDTTCSRVARLFAGYIDDLAWDWDGKLKIWHVACAGSSATLDDGMINGTFTAQYDDQIINSVVNTYFGGIIATNAANNVGAPVPIVRGVLIDSQNYTDNNMREVLNGLSDASGYMYYLDAYYRLNYNPQFYGVAPFALSSSPDNVSTFPYYEYHGEKDGTQRKRKVKVIGGKSGSTVQVSQVLDQDASNTPVAPAYAIRAYDAKVNDTNLISTVTTTTRGLAEVSKYGSPKTIITCKANKYAAPGMIIYFTATLDGIVNQPYVVQQVTGNHKGIVDTTLNPDKSFPVNEFQYTLGYFNPTLLDHIRNANKALNRSSAATGTNNILAVDLSVREPVVYSETVTVTPNTAQPAGVWGTARWGQFKWS